jgi:hypothetical protein
MALDADCISNDILEEISFYLQEDKVEPKAPSKLVTLVVNCNPSKRLLVASWRNTLQGYQRLHQRLALLNKLLPRRNAL